MLIDRQPGHLPGCIQTGHEPSHASTVTYHQRLQQKPAEHHQCSSLGYKPWHSPACTFAALAAGSALHSATVGHVTAALQRGDASTLTQGALMACTQTATPTCCCTQQLMALRINADPQEAGPAKTAQITLPVQAIHSHYYCCSSRAAGACSAAHCTTLPTPTAVPAIWPPHNSRRAPASGTLGTACSQASTPSTPAPHNCRSDAMPHPTSSSTAATSARQLSTPPLLQLQSPTPPQPASSAVDI